MAIQMNEEQRAKHLASRVPVAVLNQGADQGPFGNLRRRQDSERASEYVLGIERKATATE